MRRVTVYNRIGIALVTAVMGVYLLVSRSTPTTTAVKETFRLQCLSPEQAGEIVRPYMGVSGQIIIGPTPSLGLITLGGSREQMSTVRSVLERYDNPGQSQCAVQVRIPRVP